eukprot:3051174-Pleurochrysis_carterae.AAC.1
MDKDISSPCRSARTEWRFPERRNAFRRGHVLKRSQSLSLSASEIDAARDRARTPRASAAVKEWATRNAAAVVE